MSQYPINIRHDFKRPLRAIVFFLIITIFGTALAIVLYDNYKLRMVGLLVAVLSGLLALARLVTALNSRRGAPALVIGKKRLEVNNGNSQLLLYYDDIDFLRAGRTDNGLTVIAFYIKDNCPTYLSSPEFVDHARLHPGTPYLLPADDYELDVDRIVTFLSNAHRAATA